MLKPLLNKSNELLLQKNNSDHLMKNIRRVQNRLKAMINQEEYHEQEHDDEYLSSTLKKSSTLTNYCQEQPPNLRKSIEFKEKKKDEMI